MSKFDTEWKDELDTKLNTIKSEFERNKVRIDELNQELTILRDEHDTYLNDEFSKMYMVLENEKVKLIHRNLEIAEYLKWITGRKPISEDEMFITKYGLMVTPEHNKEIIGEEELDKNYISFVNIINEMRDNKNISLEESLELQERLFFRYASYLKSLSMRLKTKQSLEDKLGKQKSGNALKLSELKEKKENLAKQILALDEAPNMGEERESKYAELDRLINQKKLIFELYNVSMLIATYEKIIRLQKLQEDYMNKNISKSDLDYFNRQAQYIELVDKDSLTLQYYEEEKDYVDLRKQQLMLDYEAGKISDDDLAKEFKDMNNTVEKSARLRDGVELDLNDVLRRKTKDRIEFNHKNNVITEEAYTAQLKALEEVSMMSPEAESAIYLISGDYPVRK